MRNFDNEEAAAHGLMMVIIFFFTAALIWMAMGFITNLVLIGSVNPAITAGQVSVQTANTTRAIVDSVRYGIIGLLGIGFYWSYRRSVYVAEGGQ